jgi:hypothetical protein
LQSFPGVNAAPGTAQAAVLKVSLSSSTGRTAQRETIVSQ